MWRSDNGIVRALPPYRGHGPQTYGPTDGRLPLQIAPRQQTIASVPRRRDTRETYKRKSPKITTKKLWIVFSTLVLIVGFTCLYFGLRAANGASSGAQDQTTSAVSEETTITTATEQVLYALDTTFEAEMADPTKEAFTRLENSACSEWETAYSAVGQTADSCQMLSARNGSVVLELMLKFTLTSSGVTAVRLKDAMQVFAEQNASFSAASQCLDANIVNEFSVLLDSSNDLCGRTTECDNYHVCTPDGTSGVTCSCREGYDEVPNYGCVVNCMLANCLTCAATTSCMTCSDGYDLTNEGTCQAKCEVDNCASCINPNICNSCISHYALNTTGASPVCYLICTLANCRTCTSPTSCMTCDTGYDLSNGGSCQALCEVNNCESCADPNACDSCIPNYVLDAAVSPPVCTLNCTLANCTTCASPTSCMTCDAGYDVSNGGMCQAQCDVDNCESCANPNACDLCISNYVLNTAVSPPVCTINCTLANCTTCASPTSCMTCDTGYDVSNGGLCQAQCEVDNCESCAYPNACDSCISNYVLNSAVSPSVCTVNCTLANCTTCASPTFCMTCDAGYDVSNGGMCQAQCDVDNCESCANPNACDLCISNYVLNTAVSPPVCTINCTLANCTTCASPTSCMTCDTGYDVSNGGSCQAQCEVDNCESCAYPNACDSCISNYVLNSAVSPSVCTVNCTLANCTTCASPTFCMTCDAGYDVSNGGSCQALCYPWCVAGCIDPYYCMECPLPYRPDPDTPGNCISDCPFDNAIDTSGHVSIGDRTTAILVDLQGNGISGIAQDKTSPITITYDGQIVFPTTVSTVLQVYLYYNIYLNMTSGLFKYRQYTESDTTELTVAKGYVCKKIMEDTPGAEDCSTCAFRPSWMLHLKIEDVPINDMYSSSVPGTLNCEIIITSDGTQSFAIGYFTSVPYGVEPAVTIDWGWYFSYYTYSYKYGQVLEEDRFISQSNTEIPGVWVYTLPTRH